MSVLRQTPVCRFYVVSRRRRERVGHRVRDAREHAADALQVSNNTRISRSNAPGGESYALRGHAFRKSLFSL